mmetsp:Transcript_32392/g.107101  ORF Transcript_32392/g.107101 Transcript_32392/m.107101 type:complete len:225 (+) Transcript_32392:406-1080(+)
MLVQAVRERVKVQDAVQVHLLELAVRLCHGNQRLRVWQRLAVPTLVRVVRVAHRRGVTDAEFHVKRAAQVERLEAAEDREICQLLRAKVARAVRQREDTQRTRQPALLGILALRIGAAQDPGDVGRIMPVQLLERRARLQQRARLLDEALFGHGAVRGSDHQRATARKLRGLGARVLLLVEFLAARHRVREQVRIDEHLELGVCIHATRRAGEGVVDLARALQR